MSLTVFLIYASLPYISSFGALGAALAAFIQARKASETNAGQLFLSFSERYNSQEMADAFRMLVQWKTDMGKDFALAWEVERQKGDKRALDVNRARRLVSRYYYDVARLYDIGLIDKRLAHSLLGNNGLHVFYQVSEPMNDARHPDRERKYSKIIRFLRQEYGSNTVHGHGLSSLNKSQTLQILQQATDVSSSTHADTSAV